MVKEGVSAVKDGFSLYYTVDGDSDAPWLVLANSLATDHRMWNAQVYAFTQHRRVLRFDARGHGKSGVSTDAYTFADLADDVVQLMDKQGIDKADFCGVSMGGMTGIALAVHHPDRLNKMVCCDARADAPDPYKAIWDGNIARLHESGIEALAAPTMERWFTEAYRTAPENAETMALVRDMICSTPADGYEGAARCLQALDLLKDLGSIAVPTLYVVGDQDPAAPIAVMQDMADKTPGATLAVIDNAAHLSNMEQPAAFSDTVLTFIAE